MKSIWYISKYVKTSYVGNSGSRGFFLLDELSDIDTFQDLKDSDIDFQFVDPDEEDSH